MRNIIHSEEGPERRHVTAYLSVFAAFRSRTALTSEPIGDCVAVLVMMRAAFVSVKQPIKVPGPETTSMGAGVVPGSTGAGVVLGSTGAGVVPGSTPTGAGVSASATVGAGVPSTTKGAGVTGGRVVDEIS